MGEIKNVKKMYLTCENCGKQKPITRAREQFNNKILCDSCFVSFKKYPDEYIPPKGEIHYNSEGKVICHICGRAFNKLGYHISQCHDMSIDEYKEEFGLNRRAKITSEALSKVFKDLSSNNLRRNKGRTFQKGHKESAKARRLQARKNRLNTTYNKDTREFIKKEAE